MRNLFKAARRLVSPKTPTDRNILWEFPTVEGRENLLIELTAMYANNSHSGGFRSLTHIISIEVTGLQHPYLTVAREDGGDEMFNPALLPALQIIRDAVGKTINAKTESSTVLRQAKRSRHITFQYLNSDGIFGIAAFRATSDANEGVAKFRHVDALFRDTKRVIDAMQPEIKDHIRMYAGLQPPDNPGPIELREFHDMLRHGAQENFMKQVQKWRMGLSDGSLFL